MAAGKGPWNRALLTYLREPQRCFMHDERVVVVRDGYSKATHHYLVIPRERILNHSDLTSAHVPLLRHMISVGTDLIDRLLADACSEGEESSSVASRSSPPLASTSPSPMESSHGEALNPVTTRAHPLTRTFRCGFHVFPSMLQLHMHVISSDFVAPALKRKQHWNSFNTAYFIEADRFVERLELEGRIMQDASLKQLLSAPLECDGITFSTMPKLKQYLSQRLQDHRRYSNLFQKQKRSQPEYLGTQAGW
eukprot:CAMPEP_0174246968 /NCGR_PEP_ID=MMETSP0417-20130205/42110_1 /TAXON_ID=242541 /ORGANISM="Mayorella sp, Strain BSH-02190019" /LENGTH=250 /DNA_ID=CAMNT_0015326821 /DNA_START=38 /DNA_END=787 /DNA_ORIENTATION=+